MNEVNFTYQDDILILKLKGRISSDNASIIENEIITIKKDYTSPDIIIDIEDLEYISSAGLRVILKIRKEHANAKIINASNDIYEIFDMTGFTEMMTIEKGYRKISVEGCKEIGRGANGIVYRLDPDTIIKVYIDRDCLPDIKRERELARKAFVLGIPTAIPYDVVKVGESFGSVFELLNAKSFADMLVEDSSSIDEVIKMNVELLEKLHSTEVMPNDMPSIRNTYIGWVDFLNENLPIETYKKLRLLLENVQESNYMIHGDCHVKNVMLQNGEALLIDMDTLSRGNKIFEFAAIYSAYIGFNLLNPETVKSFFGFNFETCKKLWYGITAGYFKDYSENELSLIAKKASLLSFIRIYKRAIIHFGVDNPEYKDAIDFYKDKIINLTQEIDDLSI